MRRILFVDDEPKILEGLQRMLRPRREEWEMSFATNGEAALELLAACPFDIIVSDMQMPGMDGATLLTRVRERHPNVIRMILTGYTSLDASVRAAPVAHQFLVKPCDGSVLQVAVERACSLTALLGNELLRRTASEIRELPALPRTYAALTTALSDPDSSLDRVAQIIEQDVATSAQVLRLVNSPLFGASRHIAVIKTAVSYLGTNVLRNLVLSIETFRMFSDAASTSGFSPEKLHRHAYLTSRIAARLPTEGHLKDAAYVAALLHDVGILVLMTKLPNHFARIIEGMIEERLPMHVVEEGLTGITHAEIGAYLLGLWGLPYAIIESVAYHHAPARVPRHGFDPLATVYVANILAHEIEDALSGDSQFVHASLDQGFLESLGVLDQLPNWRAIAVEAAATAAEA